MIAVNSVKQIILSELSLQRDISWEDKTILASVIYVEYNRMLSSQKTNAAFNIKDYINSRITINRPKLQNIKDNSSTYQDIINYIISTGKNNILDFKDYNFETIYNLFNNFVKRDAFSTNYFSLSMYNANNIPRKDILKLEKIHHNIMAPIIKYYKITYGSKDEDMNIISIFNVPTNPGKIITFKIKNISPNVIIKDINNNVLGLSKYIYDANLAKDSVSILLK